MEFNGEETREVSKSEILRWRRLKMEASDGHCFIWGGEAKIVSLKLRRMKKKVDENYKFGTFMVGEHRRMLTGEI